MGKINLSNITASMNKAKEAAAPLQNRGHSENIPISFISLAEKNIYNENDNDDSIKELADNIDTVGLLHPITVNKIGTDKYQIISGERRFRAVTEHLHWRSVPCMVFDNLSQDAAQLKLCMANLSVREYSASQKYKFYLEVKGLLERMKSSGEYKGGLQKGIAEILQVTTRQVAKYHALEKLSPEIQDDVLNDRISINKALEMSATTSAPIGNLELLKNLLSSLTDEEKSKIMLGEVDISVLETLVPQTKDEPVHIFEDRTPAEEAKKDEPVHVFEDETPAEEAKKDEPVHIFEDETPAEEAKKDEPVHVSEDRTPAEEAKKDEPVHVSAQKSKYEGSVIYHKDKTYIPNKVQIWEEHEGYTILKVYAVKQV